MRKYQYVPSDQDDSESEEEERKPEAAEVAEPVAVKVEDTKVKEMQVLVEPTTPTSMRWLMLSQGTRSWF